MTGVDRTKLPDGPRGGAVLNSARLVRKPVESLLGWHKLYGDLVTVPLLVFGTGVYIADPDAIRELFTGDQSYLHAGEANQPLSVVLGNHSVLVLDGPEHLRQRRLLLPPFQGATVRRYRDVIAEVAEAEVDRWQLGDRFNMRERMRALTFEVIARVVFGMTDQRRIDRLHVALTAVLDATPLLLVPASLQRDLGRWSPWGRLQRRLQAADKLVYEEIELRRRDTDVGESNDVLSILLAARDEDGRPMSDVELRDELMTILLAGHETTATGLAFAFDLLLRDAGTRARLRDELSDGEDRYLNAVISESLRLRPVIDAAERTLTKPRTVAGHELPAGIRVYPSIVAVHHREELYPEPKVFRPERFLGDSTPSYAWLPFGGGIRRCLGAPLAQAEMAEVIRTVISRVDLKPSRPAHDPVVMRGITLVPRHGVPVEVQRVARGAAQRQTGAVHAGVGSCPA